jgi:hypothetical protein
VRQLLIVGLLLLTACNNKSPESRSTRSAGKPTDQESADGKPKKKKKGAATNEGREEYAKDRAPPGAQIPGLAGPDDAGAAGQGPGGDGQDPTPIASPEAPEEPEAPAEPALPASSLAWDGETLSGTSTLNLLPTE